MKQSAMAGDGIRPALAIIRHTRHFIRGAWGRLSRREVGVMHDSRAVANQILKVAKAQGKSLTLMQLLKLVYLAHGWRLALDDTPMTEDAVQAWQYGPVHPNVYRAFSNVGPKPIERLAEIEFVDVPYESKFDERETWIIDQVVSAYGGKHAFTLSDMLHKPGTPWSKTYNGTGPYSEISDAVIQEYFKKLRNKQVDQQSA